MPEKKGKERIGERGKNAGKQNYGQVYFSCTGY